jgi:hypothetical protein
VAVEVVHEDALEAVAAEDGVGLVDNLQGVELCTAFRVMRSGAGKDDEEEEDGTPSPHPVSLKVAGCARYADVWLVSLHDAKVRRKLERFFIFRSCFFIFFVPLHVRRRESKKCLEPLIMTDLERENAVLIEIL